MTGPDLDAAVGDQRGGVDRLHRRMRQKRRLVGRLDLTAFGRGRIASAVDDPAWLEGRALIERGPVGGKHVIGGNAERLAVIPGHFRLLEGGGSLGIARCDDCKVVGAFDKSPHAR